MIEVDSQSATKFRRRQEFIIYIHSDSELQALLDGVDIFHQAHLQVADIWIAYNRKNQWVFLHFFFTDVTYLCSIS